MKRQAAQETRESGAIDKRFVNKASGKDLHRPELEQLLYLGARLCKSYSRKG